MDSDISTDPSDYTDYSDSDNNKNDETTKVSTTNNDDNQSECKPSITDINQTKIKTATSIKTEKQYYDSTDDSSDDCNDDDSSYSYSSEPIHSDDDYLPYDMKFEPLYTIKTETDHINYNSNNKRKKNNNNNNNNMNTLKIIKDEKKEFKLKMEEIKCSHCGDIFEYHSLFRKHMNERHNIQRPYTCHRCPDDENRRRYKYKDGLENHIKRDHEMERKYKCHLCTKVFFEKTSLKYHQTVHERRDMIQCERCNDKFWSHPKYRKHMNEIHKIERPYICPRCPTTEEPKTFTSKGCLNKHIKRDHEMERKYKCHLCPKAFYEKKTLLNHHRVHDGLKPWKCPHCDLRFTQKCSQKQHIVVIHLKQKNYECKYCKKRFPSLSGMKSHAVSQHDDGKYARFECRTCHKRFYEKGWYYKHIENSHRPKEIDPKKEMIKKGECFYPGCNKKYTRKHCAESVKYHLVAVHNDREYANYKCKKCKKLFYEKTGYKRHMKNKHHKKIKK